MAVVNAVLRDLDRRLSRIERHIEEQDLTLVFEALLAVTSAGPIAHNDQFGLIARLKDRVEAQGRE